MGSGFSQQLTHTPPSHARSPILAELRAIECLSAIDDQGRERGVSWGSESTAESGRAGGAAEYYGMEVNCSICMEHLFKPMAFTPCGHMVCAPCHARLVEATGHGAPCPTCRASSGKATRMRQVNKVRASDDPYAHLRTNVGTHSHLSLDHPRPRHAATRLDLTLVP